MSTISFASPSELARPSPEPFRIRDTSGRPMARRGSPMRPLACLARPRAAAPIAATYVSQLLTEMSALRSQVTNMQQRIQTNGSQSSTAVPCINPLELQLPGDVLVPHPPLHRRLPILDPPLLRLRSNRKKFVPLAKSFPEQREMGNILEKNLFCRE